MNALPAIPFVRLRTSLPCVLLLLVLATTSGGCSRRETRSADAPGSSSAASQVLGAGAILQSQSASSEMLRRRLPYPLAVGNRWDYVIHMKYTTLPFEGPSTIFEQQVPWTSEVLGMYQIGDREYFAVSEYNPMVAAPIPGPTVATRQDRSGLYDRQLFIRGQAGQVPDTQDHASSGPGADPTALQASLNETFAGSLQRAAFERAALQLSERLATMRREALGGGNLGPGGPDPDELSMLRYPLYRGARWIVRGSPKFARMVLGREGLQTPAGRFAAWKLRGTSELYGPNDRVHFWYASAGLIRIHLHSEAAALDAGGNVVGQVVGEWDQALTQVSLLGPALPTKIAAGDTQR